MVKPANRFVDCTGFEWGAGNEAKNRDRHDVSRIECEQVFFNQPLIVKRDSAHSGFEERYYVLGRPDVDRLLFAVFTVREEKIRIISARDMTRSETARYRK